MKAQFNLAIMYYYGRGTNQDYSKALEWYKKSSVQRFSPAELNLGLMYIGYKQYKKGFEFVYRASLQDLPSAQYNLAILLQDGLGIKADNNKAYVWMSISAFNGYEPAMKMKEEFKQGLSEIEIKQDHVKIHNWQKLLNRPRDLL